MRSLDLSTSTNGTATVVIVHGSVDAVTTPRLTEALDAEVDAGRTRLVADFGGVDYVSSAGLRTILATVKRTRGEGGDLRVAAVQPAVAKVFELSGFTSIVRFFDDVDGAAASYA
ncbi:STAS domain-containing protein [soil metagenome]